MIQTIEASSRRERRPARRGRLRGRASSLLVLVLVGGSLACEEIAEKPAEGTLFSSIAPTTATTIDLLIGEGEFRHPAQREVTSLTWIWSWKLNGVDSGITTKTVPTAVTSRGQVWEVSVTVDYGTGVIGPSTSSIEIMNAPPSVDSLDFGYNPSIDDDDPRKNPALGATITALYTTSDPDGDPVTAVVEWFVTGALVETGPTLDTSPFSVNEQVRCRVTPFDGTDTGSLGLKFTRIKAPPPPIAPIAAPQSGQEQTSETTSQGLGAQVVTGSVEVTAATAIPAPSSVPISTSELNVCSIGSDGSLFCEGDESSGLTDPPAGAYSDVAVELDFACAISADDGSIQCWGAPEPDLGQLAPPVGPFTRIELGRAHGCGLRDGGEIECWGDDDLGQSSPPEGSFSHLDVSDDYGCALDAAGLVTCWGVTE